jgi:hypothetical protein
MGTRAIIPLKSAPSLFLKNGSLTTINRGS